MPVPSVTRTVDAEPRAAPYAASARAVQLASLSMITGTPHARGQPRDDVLAVPRQVRGEEHAGAGDVDETGRREPDGLERLVAGHLVHGLAERGLDQGRGHPAAGGVAQGRPPTLPSAVDLAGQHLGAADVDARRSSAITGGGPGRPRRSGRPGCRARPRRTSASGRWPRPVSWRANAARIGSSSRSPAALTPPPTTTTAGVEDRGQRGDALAEPRAQRGQLLDAERVAGLGALGDHRAGDRGGVAAGAVEERPGEQRARRTRPPAPRAPGRCRWRRHSRQPWLPQPQRIAVGHDPHVADLAAHAEASAVQAAVEHHAAADAGADRDEQQVVDVLAGAVPELAPRGGVGVVLDDDGEVDARLELGPEVEVAPGQVGREHHHRPGLVDVAGRADADGLHRVPGSQLERRRG